MTITRGNLSNRGALALGLVLAAVGAVMIGYAAAHPYPRVAERPAQARITSVFSCGKSDCSYGLTYVAAGKTVRTATTASVDEPGAGSTTTIYYQVAHPTLARFSNAVYPNDPDPGLFSVGGFIAFMGLAFLVAGGVGWMRDRRAARRAAAAGWPGWPED